MNDRFRMEKRGSRLERNKMTRSRRKLHRKRIGHV
jgi:hypothetical protein